MRQSRTLSRKVILAALISFMVLAPSGQTLAQDGTWSTSASMLTTRYYPGAAVFDGVLYVTGGCTAGPCGGTVSSTVEAYNPATDSWIPKAPMPTARGWLTTTEIGGLLYAAGGDASFPLATLEVYDPVTDSWTPKNPMPTPRAAPVAGSIDGKLLIVGGHGASPLDAYDTLDVYDPTTDAWAAKASMSTRRAYSGAGVIDGKLYVVGGLSASLDVLATLEVYDPGTDTWTMKAPMPTARVAPGAGVIGGKLYVVGGSTASSLQPLQVYDTLEVYDPGTDTWTSMSPMPTPRYGPGTGVIDGRLYAAGGLNSYPLAVLEVFSPFFEVSIDIKPGSFPNSINPRSNGVIPVAILTTDTFDAATVAPTSVRFGATGTESTPNHYALEDVNSDGKADLVLQFPTQNTGIVCATASATLTGMTKRGMNITGTDSVRTTSCK